MTTFAGTLLDVEPLTVFKSSMVKPAHRVNTLPRSATKTSVIKSAHKIGGVTNVNVANVRYVINKGHNTGSGDEYVYWLSPNEVDTAGDYYPTSGKPPWGQIENVIGVGTAKTVISV
jgi:hypothetical protein